MLPPSNYSVLKVDDDYFIEMPCLYASFHTVVTSQTILTVPKAVGKSG